MIAYAFDMPHRFDFATEHLCSELGLSREDIRAIAFQNLRRQITRLEVTGGPPIFSVTIGNTPEACVLLIEEICDKFAEKCEGNLITAVPNRQTLFFADSASELGLKIISDAVAEFYPRGGNHSLTRNLLCWKDRRWEVFRWIPAPQ